MKTLALVLLVILGLVALGWVSYLAYQTFFGVGKRD